MIYILGYKILDKTKEFTVKNCEIITCRKPFICSYDYNEIKHNETILFQLIQDIDFSEKVKTKNLLHLFVVNINPKILEESKRVTKNVTEVAKNYTCEILCNKLKSVDTENKKYIRHILDFTIDYDKVHSNMSKSISPLNGINNPYSWEFPINQTFEYPFKNLLYLLLNHNDDKRSLISLPNELIDIILKFLKSKIELSFMAIYPSSYYDDNFLLITPSLCIQNHVLKY
tara:strand:- start:1723 stop:2409 length:687 start_codon:yes stop_codon:yes gene_type:complete